MLSHDVASETASAIAFKPFDLWGSECFGLREFMLISACEPDELLDFSNREERQEDERFLLTATDDLRSQMALTVVQLLPLTPEEWEVLSRQDSAMLLESLT